MFEKELLEAKKLLNLLWFDNSMQAEYKMYRRDCGLSWALISLWYLFR